MTVERKGKTYNIPDEVIDKYVDTLECSVAEAIDIWFTDNDVDVNEEQDTLDAAAKKVKIAVGAGRGKEKAQKERVKKENPVKKDIISAVFARISPISDTIEVRNDEKYIDFTIDGRNFTINLVEHRKK